MALISTTALSTALTILAAMAPPAEPTIELVTTVAPFPRGLALVDGDLYILCRGRVRSAGGVTAQVDDQAGTIYVVDPEIASSLSDVDERVRTNGKVFAQPTAPPFQLWDRASVPPQRDRHTDRPYCTLRYHEPTRSFYVCAFSGIDKPQKLEDPVAFSKNLTDAILRYDRRTSRWHEVERHDIEAGGNYPHHDPRHHTPPHGWLNGPDNCLALGHWLYAVAKDNSLLVRYDLRALEDDPDGGPPPSELVVDEHILVEGLGERDFFGQSALAFHDGWLYVAYRTSSVIVRFRLDEGYELRTPIRAQLVARFDPYDPQSGTSANLTDMTFDDQGRLYVISAQPARIYRFQPSPRRIFDARSGRVQPWADLARMTANPQMKSENLLFVDGSIYVTSGDSYGNGARGAVYRMRSDER